MKMTTFQRDLEDPGVNNFSRFLKQEIFSGLGMLNASAFDLPDCVQHIVLTSPNQGEMHIQPCHPYLLIEHKLDRTSLIFFYIDTAQNAVANTNTQAKSQP